MVPEARSWEQGAKGWRARRVIDYPGQAGTTGLLTTDYRTPEVRGQTPNAQRPTPNAEGGVLSFPTGEFVRSRISKTELYLPNLSGLASLREAGARQSKQEPFTRRRKGAKAQREPSMS